MSDTPLIIAAKAGNVDDLAEALATGDINVHQRDTYGRTALLCAAEGGHIAVVERLLAVGAGNIDVNQRDNNDRTALSYAAEGGHIAVVERLLDVGAGNIDINQRDRGGRTILSYAAKGGHIAVVERLLAMGAGDIDVHQRDTYGRTTLLCAAEGGHIAVVERLLDVGAGNIDINQRDRGGRTILSYAAKGGHIAVVERLLAMGAGDIDVNQRDYFGRTILSYAAEGGHIAVVERLLDVGAGNIDINQRDTYGLTALLCAAEGGHIAVVERLLDVGAGNIDINQRDRGGRTILSYAAKGGHNAVVERLLAMGAGDIDINQRDYFGRTTLSYAAEGGHIAVVERLLTVSAGDIDINQRDNGGRTTLSYAAEGGHIAVVERLLAMGAGNIDVNQRDNNDRTALSYAAEGGHIAVVERLLDVGAGNIDINQRDRGGRTTLSYAAEGGHIAVVERLLLAGAGDIDINQRDNGGRTTLSYAAEGGHIAVVEQLLDVGANPNLRDLVMLTPLWFAALKGCTAIVKLLLECGLTDVNPWSDRIDENKFRTPLALALKNRHQETAELLAHADGIDALLILGDDYSPSVLGLAIESGYQEVALALLLKCRGRLERSAAPLSGDRDLAVESASRLLVYASSANYLRVADELLKKHGADVNAVCRCGPFDLSPLMAASKKGNAESVSFLLTIEGILPNVFNSDGSTALILASIEGFVDVVKMLVSDERVAVDQSDKKGRTVLSHAAEHAHEDVVTVLLDTGRLDTNSRDQNGRTSLAYAAGLKGKNAVNVVRLLLNVSSTEQNPMDHDGNTLLMYAAASGSVQMIELLTVSTNIDINLQNQQGMSALHMAVRSSFSDSEEDCDLTEKMRALIAVSGIKANIADSMGRTALSYAAEGGMVRLVEILLEADGVDPDLNADGRSPLSWALPKTADSQELTKRREEVVRLLLSNSNLDPNAEDAEGLTPLIRAIQCRNRVKCVELMLERPDLDVNQQGRNGLSPLAVAEEIDNTTVIELLHSRGATAPERPLLDANSQINVEGSPDNSMVLRRPKGGRISLGTQQEYIDEWVDGTESLCINCSEIDLDDAFSNHDHKIYLPFLVGESLCPLCRLFTARPYPWYHKLMSYSSTHGWICDKGVSEDLESLEAPWVDTVVLIVDDPMRENDIMFAGMIGRLGSNCPEKKYAITIPRLLGTDEGSAARMRTAREWISFCRHNHKECNPPRDNSAIPPHLRLIVCKLERKKRRIIKQHEFKGRWPPQYVALSYVWGLSPANKPHTENIGDAVEAVIEDAIKVTRELGYEYLWIDRYCIVQKGDDAVKNEQMRHMHLVYLNAEVTLVAAAGEDASAGLPGAPGRPRSYQQPGAFIKGHKLVVIPPDPYSVIKDSTWDSRGWTLQEGLLARRRLYFTNYEMSYGCRHMLCREAIQLPPGRERKIHKHKPSSRESLWMHDPWQLAESAVKHGASGIFRLLEDYTKRQLSFPEDALNAILGVLQLLADNKEMPLYHVCGVPILRNYEDKETDGNDGTLAGFVSGLCWTLTKQTRRRQGFPTWSWTGWTGQVDSSGFIVDQAPFKTSLNLSIVPRDGERGAGVALPWDRYYGLRHKTDDDSKAIWSGQNHMLEITAAAATVRFDGFHSYFYGMVCVGDRVWRGEFKLTWNGGDDVSDYAKKSDDIAYITDSLKTALLQKPWEAIVLGSSTPSPPEDKSPYTYVLVVQEQQQTNEQLPPNAQTRWERLGILRLELYELEEGMMERKTWLIV